MKATPKFERANAWIEQYRDFAKMFGLDIGS